VTLVVPFAPGGIADIMARIVAQSLSERLGQPVVIDNRPGPGAVAGTQAVVNAAPDGYTLLLAGSANSVNATLRKNTPFDFLRDIAPVAGIARLPVVIAAGPKFRARNVAELIASGKANPGKINMASPGIGTPAHLSGELFMAMTGIKLTHVPYRGSAPAITDVTAGNAEVLFDNLSTSLASIKAGQLHALAVTTGFRHPAQPDVPPVADTVPGYEASTWYGVGAPKGTPAAVIAKMNRSINETLADPAIKAKIEELGGIPMSGAPEDIGRLIAAETEKWAKIIKSAGISSE
jgi:tripartite-type tricarboxylate transporter receptor subunit TctC